MDMEMNDINIDWMTKCIEMKNQNPKEYEKYLKDFKCVMKDFMILMCEIAEELDLVDEDEDDKEK